MRARLNQYHLVGNCDSRRHFTSSLTENVVVTETRSSRMLEMLLFFDQEKTSSQMIYLVRSRIRPLFYFIFTFSSFFPSWQCYLFLSSIAN